ncbi:hypothetical protein PO591_20790 [Escherichia coli]|uniref:hypothetical protein n=1 Tax=Escherichia coli TaxID=562 RepID=UPI00259CAAC5|nr:hypothetical protein [Escherichia coli]MDM4819886.1 hypothetical protein [Escherichia coli]MDM4847748.1 hypothetical protein [Escherichia coli]HBB3243410.1 hypothetical protein [Escherichia coli]HBB3254629.1 hypothetical protein [Escherichia coli]HBB3359173.1 hypothetical protein [Escherichia coli]
MTVTVKAQQIISGYLRAASPALVLFVIQLMAYFVFVTINDIQLLPTEWGGVVSLCMVTLAATACAFYDPNKKEYLISVAGIFISWLLLTILLAGVFIHTGSLSFLTVWHISTSLLITAFVQTLYCCVMFSFRKK